MGYKGPAVVVVSCVTVDPPYRPHPHNLVGKEGCKKGVCTMTINNDSMQCVFSNLGIQCVKKRDVEDALKLREEIRVDPFQSKCVWLSVWFCTCTTHFLDSYGLSIFFVFLMFCLLNEAGWPLSDYISAILLLCFAVPSKEAYLQNSWYKSYFWYIRYEISDISTL